MRGVEVAAAAAWTCGISRIALPLLLLLQLVNYRR